MRRLLPTLALFAAAFFTASAHADVYAIYDLNGTLAGNAGTVSGTVTLDESSGKYSAANFTVTYGTTYSFNTVFSGTFFSPAGITNSAFLTSAGFSGPYFALVSDAGSLVNFTGGMCTLANECSGDYSYLALVSGATVGVASGSLTNAAVTPEPSSLILLGTGALGMVGAVRRRFIQA